MPSTRVNLTPKGIQERRNEKKKKKRQRKKNGGSMRMTGFKEESKTSAPLPEFVNKPRSNESSFEYDRDQQVVCLDCTGLNCKTATMCRVCTASMTVPSSKCEEKTSVADDPCIIECERCTYHNTITAVVCEQCRNLLDTDLFKEGSRA